MPGVVGSGWFGQAAAVQEGEETLGMVAGSLSLPLIFAREVRQRGLKRLVVVAAEGATDPRISEWADEVVWLKVGQLGKMIRAFTDRGVKRCVMLGMIAPRSLFDVRPDMRGLSVLMRL
jgi:DUF1009 family protein